MSKILLDQGIPYSTTQLDERSWLGSSACQEGLNGAMLAQLLHDIWPKVEKVVEDGAMITVTEKALRIRRLPVFKSQ